MRRFVLFVILSLFWALEGTPSHAALQSADTVKLSAGPEDAAKSMSAGSPAGVRAILIDVASMRVDGAATVLSAIDDLRRAGGVAVAVCPNSAAGIKDGAAVVALACDAIVFIKSAEITGADDSWCPSASRRDDIAEKLATLGRINPLLAARFVSCSDALSWSSKAGFTADNSGATKLATAGSPIQCGSAQLRRVGVATAEYDTVDAALKAIADGTVKPRGSTSTTPGGGLGGTGSPRAPAVPPAGTQPGANPKGTPSPAATDPKLAPKLAEYAATLGELKKLVREFDDYYTGVRGTWTNSPRGLKRVWEQGSEHTRDADTKVTCQRLQRDIKTKISSLGSIAKMVERIAKDREHPEVVRMNSHKAALDGFRVGIERNKVSNYDTFFKQVLALN
jgi:hypothetical protein